jgi:hypothetical protein
VKNADDGEPGRLAPPGGLALVASRDFGLRAGVILWYHLCRSNIEGVVFEEGDCKKRQGGIDDAAEFGGSSEPPCRGRQLQFEETQHRPAGR